MFSSRSSLLLSLLLASYVSAHGFVHQFTVNGNTFSGARPSGQRSNTPSAIRQITDPSPIYGANNPDVNCGTGGGFLASEVAEVKAGDVLEFDWRGADLSKWPHNVGPIITYLADCGDSCVGFDSTKARWFKIEQQGYKSNGNEWVQQDLFEAKTVGVKIPSSIAPGNYLMRHEIIALHIAQTRRMAEFYASCAQLSITGSGTGKPSPNELVSIPGVYSDDDEGIHVNVFGQNPQEYVFPGPPVAALVGGNTGGSGNGGSGSGSGSTGGGSGSGSTGGGNGGGSGSGSGSGNNNGGNSTNNGGSGSGSTGDNGNSGSGSDPSTTSSGSTKKTCKLKRSNKPKPTPQVRPRHISRIMRRLAFSGGLDVSKHAIIA